MGWFPCCCGRCTTCLTYYTEFLTGSGYITGPNGLPTGWSQDLDNIEAVGSIVINNGSVTFYGEEYGAWITNAGASGLNGIPTGSTGEIQIESHFFLYDKGTYFAYILHHEDGKQRRYEFGKDKLTIWDHNKTLGLLAVQEYNALKDITNKNMRVSFCIDPDAIGGTGANVINLWNKDNLTDIYLDSFVDPWKKGDSSISGGYIGADVGAGGTGTWLPPIPPGRNSGELIFGDPHGAIFDYYIYSTDENSGCCPCTGIQDLLVGFSGCSTCATGSLNFTVTGFRCHPSWNDFCQYDTLCHFMQGFTFEDIPFLYIDWGISTPLTICGRCTFGKLFLKDDTGLDNNMYVTIKLGCGEIAVNLTINPEQYGVTDIRWGKNIHLDNDFQVYEYKNICISGGTEQLGYRGEYGIWSSCPSSIGTVTGYLSLYNA